MDVNPIVKEPREKDVVANLGIQLDAVTKQDLERLNVQSSEPIKGVFLNSVDPNSLAFREGDLRPGDIVSEIDRKPIETKADFLSAYENVPKGETFLLRAYRTSQNPDGSTVLRSFLTALTKPE